MTETAHSSGGELEPGAQVGRYIVLHRAGAGAMGVVYAAHDPELDRRVAIKLLHTSRSQSVGESRVLSEARAMAKLSHPNVVGVFEVGTLGNQTFVAMEFVEGLTLPEWLSLKPRRWREVVNVMAGAARGLAAAHDAGIVHRDVKPTNIVVTSTGTARVLDFGLARAAHASASVVQSGVFAARNRGHSDEEGTHNLETAGTPAYMAPEQCNGIATAKSDQYAFCATLYEALFGRSPDPVRAASVTRYENPGRVAPALDEKFLRKGGAIPTWLWRVIRRGLSTYPEARHASMHVLAAELDRKPEPWRMTLIAVAATLACLAIATVAVRRELSASSHDPCAGAAAGASKVWGDAQRRGLLASFSSTGGSYASQTAARVADLLAARTGSWSAMRRDACAATLVHGTQSERLLDLRMACLDRRLSEQEALTNLLVRDVDADIVDKSVEAVRSLPAISLCANASALLAAYPPPTDPAVAEKLDRLEAQVDHAKALRLAGKYSSAVALLAPIQSRAKALGHPPLTAEMLLELSYSQGEDGDAAAAEHSVSLALPAAALARDDALLVTVMARWIFVVGYLQDRHSEALAAGPFAEALAQRNGHDSEPEAELLKALGGAHLNAGEYAAARTAFEGALEITEKLTGPDDPRRGRALNNLGLIASYQGKNDEAIRYLKQAIAVWERALGPDHPSVAIGLNNLGLPLRDTGRDAEARASFERALTIWEHAHGPNHPDVSMALANLATSARREGRLDEAKALAERALTIGMRVHGPDNHRTALSMAELGDILFERKQYVEGEAILQRALAILEKTLSPTNPNAIEVRVRLSRNQLALGHADEAIAVLEPALKVAESQQLAALPQVQIALAHALWAARKARPRALALATQAREELAHKEQARLTFDDKRALRDVATWLTQPSAGG